MVNTVIKLSLCVVSGVYEVCRPVRKLMHILCTAGTDPCLLRLIWVTDVVPKCLEKVFGSEARQFQTQFVLVKMCISQDY